MKKQKPDTKILAAIGLMVSMSVPAMAEYSVGLELTTFKATGQDTIVGTESTTPPYANQVLDYGGELNFTLSGSYDNFRFSHLFYETESHVGDPPAGSSYIFALDHPNSAQRLYTSMDADSSVKMNMIDVGYVTSINDKLNYVVGLRVVDYKTEFDATFLRAPGGPSFLNRSADSFLAGFRAALEMNHPINDMFSIETTLAFSLMIGTNDFKQYEDRSGYQRNLKTDVTVPGYEMSVKAIWKVAGKGKAWVAYDIMRFQRLASYQVFVDDVNDASQIQDGIDAGFHGIKLGFSWSF